MIVKSLGQHVIKDIHSLTGRNIHWIKQDTGIIVRIGVTRPMELKAWQSSLPPEGEEWKFPLLSSLLAIRDTTWEIIFDDETESVGNNITQLIIDNVCISR